MSVERKGSLRSSWSSRSWRAIGRTKLGLNVSRAMVMADNVASKSDGGKGGEDAAKFAPSLAEGGSSLFFGTATVKTLSLYSSYNHGQCSGGRLSMTGILPPLDFYPSGHGIPERPEQVELLCGRSTAPTTFPLLSLLSLPLLSVLTSVVAVPVIVATRLDAIIISASVSGSVVTSFTVQFVPRVSQHSTR